MLRLVQRATNCRLVYGGQSDCCSWGLGPEGRVGAQSVAAIGGDGFFPPNPLVFRISALEAPKPPMSLSRPA